MASPQFNIIISGVSVSGDLDSLRQTVKIYLGNSDRIGYAEFALQNSTGTYSQLTISGNATCQIDYIPASGVIQTVFRGTVEEVENQVSVKEGSISILRAYSKEQELFGMISPDARLPSLLNSDGTINVAVSPTSGDQGLGNLNGMDLAGYVSGLNITSGATLSDFMCQWYGRSGDFTGTDSGSSFSFKPYISGITYQTYYVPDASGYVRANDSNLNYWIPISTHKVRREYAWDALRKLCRNAIPIDRNGNKTQFEVYCGVSGDIHIFTSGSYEYVASGIVLQYYAAGTSGSTLNNIIDALVPFNTTKVKNYIVEWFPTWTQYPTDKDYFSDFYAYSGGNWVGQKIFSFQAPGTLVLSGNNPAPTGIGTISIWGFESGGAVGAFGLCLNYTVTSGSINVSRFNASGTGGVSLNYQMKKNTSGAANGAAETRSIYLADTSGNFIQKFGSGTFLNLAPPVNAAGNWTAFNEVIYTASGTFWSGKGDGFSDNGWNQASGAITGTADLTRISVISIGIRSMGSTMNKVGEIFVDNVYFSFNYPFSPVVAFNSGSIGMGYGRRYAIVEYPFEVAPEQASGLVTHELNSRMGQKGVGRFTVRDNPVGGIQAQMNIKPGQVFVIDAPSLNTGSGQTFFYWKAIDVIHDYSAHRGFFTTISAVPWFSGTITAPYSNLIDYELPLAYQQPTARPQRNNFMPISYPHFKPPL